MKKYVTILSLILLFPLTLTAQSPVEERMEVRLVELDVRVLDLAGKPVTGLTADDFTIRDNGRKREIDSIEEITATEVPPERTATYLPRSMVLIDFENIHVATARKLFPRLREMIRARDETDPAMGLAVNANGIDLIQDFTTSSDDLLAAVDLIDARFGKERNQWSFGINKADGAPLIITKHAGWAEYLRDLYRENIETMTRFVNYLGTYHGRKNLIVISDVWQKIVVVGQSVAPLDNFHAENLDNIEEIQTASLFAKVTVNVVNTRPRSGDGTLAAPQGFPNQQKDYVGLTGGFHFYPTANYLGKAVEEMIDLSGQYYRIRYYADKKRDKYRAVKVRAKGINRVVYCTQGYLGSGVLDVTDDIPHETIQRAPRELSFDIPTEWVDWLAVGARKYQAAIVIGQRAYDASGRLLKEKVTPYFLTKRGSKTRVPLSGSCTFDVTGHDVARIEALIVDTVSGRRIMHEQTAEPES